MSAAVVSCEDEKPLRVEAIERVSAAGECAIVAEAPCECEESERGDIHPHTSGRIHRQRRYPEYGLSVGVSLICFPLYTIDVCSSTHLLREIN